MIMNKCLIISGGSIDPETAASFCSHGRDRYDLIICADRGLETAAAYDLVPHVILGDYDSLDPHVLEGYEEVPGCRAIPFPDLITNEKPQARVVRDQQVGLNISFYQFPSEKDESDTEIALKYAMADKPDRIDLLGVTGSRLDHTLASIDLLRLPLIDGIDCRIIDGHNRIRMIDRELVIPRERQYGHYVSVLAWTDRVSGLSLEGMKYPLEDAFLYKGSSLGCSNEILAAEGRIRLTEGLVLVIESRD